MFPALRLIALYPACKPLQGLAPCLSYTLRSSSIKSDHDDGSSMSPSWTIKIGLLGRFELPILRMRRSPDRRAAALPGGTNRFWLM